MNAAARFCRGCSHIRFRHERYSLPSSSSRTVRPCHCSAGCSPLLYMAPDSSSSANLRVSCAVYAEPLSVSHCTGVSGGLSPKRFSTDLSITSCGPDCHSLPCLLPSLWPHGRSSPARTLPSFSPLSQPNSSHLNTSAYRFLPPLSCPYVSRFGRSGL